MNLFRKKAELQQTAWLFLQKCWKCSRKISFMAHLKPHHTSYIVCVSTSKNGRNSDLHNVGNNDFTLVTKMWSKQHFWLEPTPNVFYDLQFLKIDWHWLLLNVKYCLIIYYPCSIGKKFPDIIDRLKVRKKI